MIDHNRRVRLADDLLRKFASALRGAQLYAASHPLVGRNIQALIAGRPTSPFRYTDFGSLATIGRHSAVTQLPNFKFSGLLAWWFWLVLHIYFLIGFRSRLIVLINWAWAYFTYGRGARIILGIEEEKDTHGRPKESSNSPVREEG